MSTSSLDWIISCIHKGCTHVTVAGSHSLQVLAEAVTVAVLSSPS